MATRARRAKRTSRLTWELPETARDMHASGLLTKAEHEKITMRHKADIPAAKTSLSGTQIKALRKQTNLSQAVFARYLNLTVGYVSQLERGVKRPTDPPLVLLDVIRRKGIEAIL